MEARSLPEALEMIMEQRGCSQSQLARDLGVGQSWISMVIHGKVRATSITKVIALLDRVGWQLRITPKTEDADPVKRREFVTAAASVAFVPSSKLGPYQDHTYLRELAKRTARGRYEHGGGTIVTTAMRHVRQIKSALDGRDRQVQAAASELAVETVWTLNDVRRFDVGENVGGLALELARRSGDADAQSKAFSVLAQVQKYRGQPDRAVRYALKGVRLSDVPDEQAAWMKLRLSESLGKVPGQQLAARDVIEDIQGFLAHRRSLNGQATFDVASMMGVVGRELYELGAYREAQAALDEAVRGLGHWPREQALNLAWHVLTAFQARQPALAADRMLALTRVAPLVESARLSTFLGEVLTMSAHWRAVPEVAAARDQLRTVLQGDSGQQP